MATLKREVKKLPSEQNLRLLSSLILSLSSKVQSTEDKCIAEWEPDKAYIRNQSYVTHENKLYVCVVSCSDSVWTPSHFQVLSDEINEIDLDTVKSWLNLSQEELDNLQKLLKDDQITTTSTFSSSKIYSDIQAAIETAKEYTNEQTGKCVKPAYKVVASTSEVTETGYFYLISNGTNFDMYVLSSDGSVVSLGTSDVDLSDYAKLTDLDNYYDKSTSDGKFATITTVDGKVDKTNIVDNLTSIDTDKPLSANQGKVLKDEVDLKANDSDVVKKTDIVTTIDGTSTDEQIYSAKGIYNSLINKVDNPIILNTADEVNSFDRVYQSFIIVPSVAEAVGLPKAPDSTWFCINLSHVKGFKYPSQIAFEYAGIERIMYRTAHNGVWHNWRKIPTTSVADVPETEINTTNTNLTTDGTCCYLVENGICYVSLWGIKSSALNRQLISSGMPKPKIIMSGSMCYDETTSSMGHHGGLLYIKKDGVLMMDVQKANISLYGSFSYPVAE